MAIVADGQICAGHTPPPRDPPNPVGNTLHLSCDGAHVVLGWTAPASDATHDPASLFRVYRSLSAGGGFAAIGASPTASFTDADAALPGGPLFYQVGAENAGGTSGEEPPP